VNASTKDSPYSRFRTFRAYISHRTRALGPAYDSVLFLTILASQSGLILTGEINFFHATVLTAGFFVAGFKSEWLSSLPSFAWNLMLVLVLIGSLVSAFYPINDFEAYFRAMAYFLAYVLLIRYITRQNPRDDLIVLLLSLLEISAAGIMTISPSYMASLIVFTFFSCTALLLFHLEREVERQEQNELEIEGPLQQTDKHQKGKPGNYRKVRYIPSGIYGFSLVSAVSIMLAGVLIFFMIPRVGRSLFAWSTGIHSRVSGFSDEVRLGSVGDLILSDSLVMRVKLDEGVDGENMYLKGNALDRYEDNTWKDKARYKKPHYYRYDTIVTLEKVDDLSTLVKQEIVLEPIDSSVLFAMPDVKAVSAPFKFRAIIEHWNDYISFPINSPIYDRVVYTVWSRPQPRTMAECESAWSGEDPYVPAWIKSQALQLPEGYSGLEDLASQASAEAATVCGKAFAIRDFLKNNYGYDLVTEADQAEDPIQNFLYESRTGYCEHFATSLALMMRSIGIPCRIGTGYMGGQYNPIEEYYVVRENRAHTWVEMYLPDGRWLLLDPTPPGFTDPSSNPAVQFFSDVLDAIRYRWDRWIVNLTILDQFQMARSLQNSGYMAGRNAARMPRAFLATIKSIFGDFAIVVVIALIAAVLLLWIKKPGRSRSSGGQEERDQVRLLYMRLVKNIERKGIVRSPSETAREYSGRVRERGLPGSELLQTATELYLRVVYGDFPRREEALTAIMEAEKAISKKSR